MLTAIHLLVRSKNNEIRDLIDDWTLRDSALESLKRIEPILAHFSDCQSFKMMVPEMVRNRSSELTCTSEEWDDIMEGNSKASHAKNDLLRDSGRARATIQIKNLTCF